MRAIHIPVECRVTAEYLAFVAVWYWEGSGEKAFTRQQLLDEAREELVLWGELAFDESTSPERHARLARNPRLAEARALVAKLFPEFSAAAREVPS